MSEGLQEPRRIMVTGGAGFIGSAVIRIAVGAYGHSVLNVDKLTYASNLASLDEIAQDPRYSFLQADICDEAAMRKAFADFKPQIVMHLAAESHVDRSIDGPGNFIRTNIQGTYVLLEAAREYFHDLTPEEQAEFRFHHVSTDEVFGSLGAEGLFTEETAYDPSSPYSASKAASDHLVTAWGRTFGLPVVLSNCSNNYGPCQFPEKLIPLMILNAMAGEPLPVYGKGDNVRDWLYVDDHARGLLLVALKGRAGETYNIGGNNERTNMQVVKTICAEMDRRHPEKAPHDQLIKFVPDRPGHDQRYAIDATKITSELGWVPQENFDTGLARTVAWYVDNTDWWKPLREGEYAGERLGLATEVQTGIDA